MYELQTNASVNSIYGKFRRCFKGGARSAWDEIIDGETKSEADFEDQVVSLVVGELGIDILKYQIKYLRKTKNAGKHDHAQMVQAHPIYKPNVSLAKGTSSWRS